MKTSLRKIHLPRVLEFCVLASCLASTTSSQASRGTMITCEIFIAERKFSTAFNLLDEAIAKNPDDKPILDQLSRLAAKSGQQPDRDEAALKEYLQYTPPPQNHYSTRPTGGSERFVKRKRPRLRPEQNTKPHSNSNRTTIMHWKQ